LTVFCGDVEADNTLRIVGEVSFRADRYANDTNPNRLNPWSTGEYLPASCDVIFVAPRQSAAVSGTWSLTEGSPFATRVGEAHALSVGTTITGEGVDAGTFLKRVFPDGSIELSKTATATVASSELQFAAFAPVLKQAIGRWRTFGANGKLQARQYGENDGLEITVNEVVDASTARIIDVPSSSGFYPGTVVIRNGADNTGRIVFGRARVAFDAVDAGKTSGFPNAPTQQLDANSATRLTVTNGLAAVLGAFSNAVGTVTKDGAGALMVNLTDAATVKLGTFAVEAGTLTLQMPAGVRYAAKGVSVAAGATLVLSGEGFAVDTVNLAPGARIVGPGTLEVQSLSAEIALAPTLAEVTLENGASVDYAGKSEAPVYEAPATVTADELGDPALWLDIKSAGSVVTAEDGVSVERWNDRRGDGHMYAEKMTAAPTLVKDGVTPLHVCMEASKVVDQSVHQVLVWNQRLTNIRAVFVVKNCCGGGGSLLGDTTSGVWAWKRAPTTDFSYQLFDEPSAAISNGRLYMNGERRDPSTGYGYPGACLDTAAKDFKPLLVECITTGDTAADNFSFHTGRGQMISGGMRLYEALVYTNELTNLQRVKIEKYLMDRWVDRGYSPEAAPQGAPSTADSLDLATDASLGVADGRDVVLRTVSGAGSLTKSGSGTLHVMDHDRPSADLSVRDGTLSVRSIAVSSASLPGTPAFHVDASKTNTLTLGNNLAVSAWRDVRGGTGFRSAAKISGCWGSVKLVENAVGDKPAVSFGNAGASAKGADYNANSSPELAFSESIATARTYVAVTKARSGVILGNAEKDRPYLKDGVYAGVYRREFGLTATWPFAWANQYYRNSSIDYRYGLACSGPGATYFRINGVSSSLTTAVPADEFQLLALSAIEGVRVSGFTQSCYVDGSGVSTYYYGGNSVAEAIYYAEALSKEDLIKVESYLNAKWFGISTAGYRLARAGQVDVAEGATLELVGGAPIEVSALNNAGTVDGSVTVRNGGSLGVTVNEDGTVADLGITGTLALVGDGTLTLTGAVRKVKAGSWLLASNVSMSGTWSADTSAAPGLNKTCRIRYENGNLYLDVISPGLMLIVR